MKKISHSLFAYTVIVDILVILMFLIAIIIMILTKRDNDISNVFFTFFILIGVTTFLFARVVSGKILKPLNEILKGVHQYKEGNYSHKIVLKSKNEYAIVAKALNDLATGIDDEKRLTRQLETSRKQLVMDISHDLKNPLANVLGYSTYLQKDIKRMDESEIHNYLQIIVNNSTRANHLIEDLFDFTKLDANDYELHLEELDFCQFIREVIMEYLPEIEEKHFHYEFIIPEEPLILSFSPKEMKRAISNLFENAIKYNGHNIELKVEVIYTQRMVRLIISDNGIGIPKELQESIFSPFKRVDPSRNSKTGGSGLGLCITKKIIDMHNGCIILQSDVGKGTVFRITLPRDGWR